MSGRYYPYEVLTKPGELTVTRVTIDGNRPERDVQAQVGTLDFSELPPWKRALIRFDADLPADDLARLADDVQLVATVHCGATNLRSSALLEQVHGGRWRGEIAVDRALLADRAELLVIAAGRTDGVPDRYLGRTESVRIFLQAPSRPLPNNMLPVRWTDFLKEDAPVPSEFRGQPHYTDVMADPPTVWLNSSMPGLRNLLAEGRGLAEEVHALRDVYILSIATAGWLALFNASIAGITDPDSDSPGMPPLPWQEQALRSLLPKIYPELTDEAAVAHLVEDSRDPDGARVLQARAQAAIGDLLRSSNTLRRAIERVQREPNPNLEEEQE